MSDLGDIIAANTETRPWTKEDWRRCLERAKDHPGFEPKPYVVVSPAQFAQLVADGVIDADGNLLPRPGQSISEDT